MAYRWSRSLTSFIFSLTALTAAVLTLGVGTTSTTASADWPDAYSSAISYHHVALDAAMLALIEPVELRMVDRQETPSIVAAAAFDVDTAHFAKMKVREATDDYRRLRIDYS